MGSLAKWLAGCRALVDRYARHVEADDAHVAYERAIADRLAATRLHARAFAERQTDRDRLAAAIANLTEQAAALAPRLTEAVRAGDDPTALGLITQQQAIAERLNGLQALHARASAESELARASVIAAQAAVAELRAERDALVAREARARARYALELRQGAREPRERAAHAAWRERIERLEAEAEALAELQPGLWPERLAALDEAARAQAARAELESLKRQHGGPG